MAEKTQFKMEVPTMDTSSRYGTIAEASDYHFTHDKVNKEIVPSQLMIILDLGVIL